MMNRHVKCLSLLLALMMALCAVCTAAAEQEKRKMENHADADEWIAVFLGEHPEELDRPVGEELSEGAKASL